MSSRIMNRTERHRQIGEAHLRAHQAMTEAHIAGRVPASRSSLYQPGTRVFMPQTGVRVIQNSIYGDKDPKDGALKELMMFWQRIPDFGIKEFEIYASETGWLQVQKWWGTGEDGKLYAAQDAVAHETDSDFNVVYAEVISDTRQWMKVAAYANGQDPEAFTSKDYFSALAAQRPGDAQVSQSESGEEPLASMAKTESSGSPDEDPSAERRIERHCQMAEDGLREIQAFTEAHLAGKEPVITRSTTTGVPASFFTPQGGESVREQGITWGGSEKHLKELQIYWARIPDFGIDARIFPGEDGWAQVLYWSGTADNGELKEAQEIDVFKTDENFNIVRKEIYSDLGQWKELLTFLGYGDMIGANYWELIRKQHGGTK